MSVINGSLSENLLAFKAPVLMYHRLAQSRKDSIVPGQYVSPGLFRRQLQMLKWLGYNGCALNRVNKVDKPAVLTFDDGYLNFFKAAMPIMKEFGFTATVFIVSDRVGGTNEWDTVKGDVEEPLMDWVQIREAVGNGHEIGCHTCTHPRLTELPTESKRREIEDSKRLIEDETGKPCTSFCFPYGSVDEEVRAIVKQAGFERACEVTKGPYTNLTPPLSIPRLNVRSDTFVPILAYKLWRTMHGSF